MFQQTRNSGTINDFCNKSKLLHICLLQVLLVLVVLSSGRTSLGTFSPPEAALCVTSVQAEVWFRGCSPTCWPTVDAPVREAPAFPRTPLPLTPPLRRSWRRITMGAPPTLDSTNTSTDTLETPTVSYIMAQSLTHKTIEFKVLTIVSWAP